MKVYVVEETLGSERTTVAVVTNRKKAEWLSEQHRSEGVRRVIAFDTDDYPVNLELGYYLVVVVMSKSGARSHTTRRLYTRNDIIEACESYGLPVVVADDDDGKEEMVVADKWRWISGHLDDMYATVVLAESGESARAIAYARVLGYELRKKQSESLLKEAET